MELVSVITAGFGWTFGAVLGIASGLSAVAAISMLVSEWNKREFKKCSPNFLN